MRRNCRKSDASHPVQGESVKFKRNHWYKLFKLLRAVVDRRVTKSQARRDPESQSEDNRWRRWRWSISERNPDGIEVRWSAQQRDEETCLLLAE
jgi:hypothetical protein